MHEARLDNLEATSKEVIIPCCGMHDLFREGDVPRNIIVVPSTTCHAIPLTLTPPTRDGVMFDLHILPTVTHDVILQSSDVVTYTNTPGVWYRYIGYGGVWHIVK